MAIPEPLAPSLGDACVRWGARPAITFHGATTSYAELWERVAGLAASLRHMGVGRGDRVVCQLPNCPEHIVVIAASWALGAIHVGTDNDLTGEELAGVVTQVGASALVYQPRAGAPDPLGPLEAVTKASPGTRLVLHDPSAGAGPGEGGLGRGAPLGLVVERFSDLVAPSGTGGCAAGDSAATAVSLGDPGDTVVLLLTSGTTGRSKAVRESRAACWAKMAFFADAYSPGPEDVHLVFLPIAHVFGFRLALIALLSGGRLVLVDRFSPAAALDTVTEQGVTILPGMPTHLTLLLAALDPRRHRVSTLEWCISAASQLPRHVAQGVYERLGARMLYVFGCAEGFTTRTTDPSAILDGSVGSTVFVGPPGTAQDGTVAILGPDGHPQPPGEVGEIAFGARCPVLYWDDPPTATGGHYLTGDLGRIDSQGRLFVVGRLKELVNRGGLKVSPSEIEIAMLRHEAIADAAVIPTPDPVLGEAICACVVISPSPAPPPDLAELRSFLGARLARHKLPDELCPVEVVPRTKIGKVDRAALASLVVGGDLPRERLRPAKPTRHR